MLDIRRTGIILTLLPAMASVLLAGNYHNFDVAIYTRAHEVREMSDTDLLDARWKVLAEYIKPDKVYLETHRDGVMPTQEQLDAAKRFFAEKGVRTAGGITLTIDESNRFQTFCYSSPEDLAKLKEIVEYTARNFDEFILDDFYFTNCKCERCIRAKGDRRWSEFRTRQLADVARSHIIGPAKAVNPDVKVVIKYPNWYDHFQYLGFNLEEEPRMFDGIYTGTETRDPVYGHQHLQQYQSYSIFRYFENLKPGGNGGGWIDPAGRRFLDRYGEQIWLTLFAKAPEVTLFSYSALLSDIRGEDGAETPNSIVGRVAGYVFERADAFLGQLGTPVGVKSYKPYHSDGEDFLHSYIGMLGIPMDIVPEFPSEERIVFLTESAKYDPEIVGKIRGQLMDGKHVVITSGLLRELQDRGLDDIADLRYTPRKALIEDFWTYTGVARAELPVLFPQIWYPTNDSWETMHGLTGETGFPIVHEASYADGLLQILTIPDNPSDLYKLPEAVLNSFRQAVAADLFVSIEAPSKVSLFVYDNDTFIVESFRENTTEVSLVLDGKYTKIRNLENDREMPGTPRRGFGPFGGGGAGKTVFRTFLGPGTYQVFRAE